MTRKNETHVSKKAGNPLSVCDRIGLDALRALDALEEQLFGARLNSIVTAEAIKRKRHQIEEQQSPPP